MPRHVYGRKTRAVYDPFAVFGSPNRSSPVESPVVQVPKVEDELAKLRISKKSGKKEKRSHVLQEKSANAVSNSVRTLGDATKGRPRARRKFVKNSEDEDSDKASGEPIILNEIVVARPVRSKKVSRDNDIGTLDSTLNALSVEDRPTPHGNAQRDGTSIPARTKQLRLTVRSDVLPEDRPSGFRVLPKSAVDEYTSHCANLLALSNHQMADFSTWSDQLSTHFDITKIAEASFGEVYRLSLLQDLSDFSDNDESVFKIIALKPPPCNSLVSKTKRESTKKRHEGMSGPDDVANEVKLLQRMSVIPGYTNFRDVRVVRGRPPPPFAKAFKDYNAAQTARKKEASHFPDPAKKTSYAEDQLWAVIEMQDAGTDLENVLDRQEFVDIWFVWDVFWQVILSLAKGEEGAEFEHRDLHLGNICVREDIDGARQIDTSCKVNFTGLETTIIDYTISRALMQDKSIAYQDLSRDNGLFEADSTDEYQYDIYRYMRGAVLYNNPYAEPPLPIISTDAPSWEGFHPISNLVWMHFILYKLLEQLQWPSAMKPPARKLKEEHARWKRGSDLEHVLMRVQELLDPGALCEEQEGLRSASDLVRLALEEGWLDVDDVVGEGVDLEECDDRLSVDALAEQVQGMEVRSGSESEFTQDIPHESPARRKPRTRRK